MTTRIKEQMRPLVSLVDNLRELGIARDVEIPQIVVVGDQSAGKSSVLEAITGVNFPRGAGLGTRCVTELRMRRSRSDDRPWRALVRLSCDKTRQSSEGEIQHKAEIGERITKLTELLLRARGANAAYEPEHSIIVEYESPDVPDLTVIDVPGIVRTAVNDQDVCVMKEVDGIVSRHLKQERTVILAVIPSDVSLQNIGKQIQSFVLAHIFVLVQRVDFVCHAISLP
jgi:interferon-induced GTP-binding protein Mx1